MSIYFGKGVYSKREEFYPWANLFKLLTRNIVTERALLVIPHSIEIAGQQPFLDTSRADDSRNGMTRLLVVLLHHM